MSLIRATILLLAVPALLAVACSDSPPAGDGDAGVDAPGTVTGTGGTTGVPGVPPGTGGATGVPGVPTGTGGTTGLPPGIPPVVLPDGGLPNLDAGLPGLIDAGVVSVCPAMPSGKMCGGAGAPIACVVENSQPQRGCVCFLQRWLCTGDTGVPGVPGADAGTPIGQPPTACPAGAQGMTCPMLAAVCTSGMGGCLCVPGGAGGGLTWRCQ